MRLDEGADLLDQPGVCLGVVEPVQDRHPLDLHGEPRRKPRQLRRVGCRSQCLLRQVALGERLRIAMGAFFRLAAEGMQTSPLDAVLGRG